VALKPKDVAMQIESNIALYRFLVRQLNERTPRVLIDCGEARALSFIVCRLEEGVHAEDIVEYRENNPVKQVEFSEGVALLAQEVLKKAAIDGWADVGFGIYVLLGMLDLWKQNEYFEFYGTGEVTRIESTLEFEREYDARVRVKQFINARSEKR
jgi:hypothetical protein